MIAGHAGTQGLTLGHPADVDRRAGQRGQQPGLTILVLAKTPHPGRSKTRLAPRFGFDGAAELAAAALADTLEAVAAAPAARRVLVLDGVVAPAVPRGMDVVAQRPGTHAERIATALAAVRGPALLIGMDTPQVTPELLTLDLIGPAPQAWLGLAEDGGWWALGLRDAARYAHQVLDRVPMSTPSTGAVQRRRLLAAGLAVADLPVLRDVDEPQDVDAVAKLAPGTRFAAAVHRLDRGRGPSPRGSRTALGAGRPWLTGTLE
jgi:glycosyltransferase A (GT-A) superfamily protein (DUF2064 family)